MQFYSMTLEDVGKLTLGQFSLMVQNMGKILEMQHGGKGSGKSVDQMTAAEKIEHYKSTGQIA